MKASHYFSILVSCMVAVLGGFLQLKAQNISAENLTLQHVTLVVSNFEESSKFYKGLLGLQEVPAPWLPDNQMFLQLGNNLELHVGEVPGVDIKPSSFHHFAITVDDLDEFLR